MASKPESCAKKSAEISPTITTDDILDEIGHFGNFQRSIFVFIFLVIVYGILTSVGFAFTASAVAYRCRIDECEGSNSSYEEPWTAFSIPKSSNEQLDNCHRYQVVNSNLANNSCRAENFDPEFKIDCGNDLIFRNDEITISNDFNIFCSDEWKLAMVGTINYLGQFIGIPLGGYLSDRYGRQLVLIYGAFISAILGTVRSFSPNYNFFIALIFLDNIFSSTLYPTAFILGIEVVGSKSRTHACSMVSVFNAIGGCLLAIAADQFRNWRLIEQVFCIPALGFIVFLWILPESFRWLLSQGKENDAIEILQTAAKINRRKLSQSKIEKFIATNEETLSHVKLDDQKFPIVDVFKMFPWRIINCSLCWFTNVLVYYGLNMIFDFFGGNKYRVFMLLSLVEIPGVLLPFFTMDRYGRRNSLLGFMFLSGISITAMTYVGSDFPNTQLIFYLLAKLCISASFQTLYFVTSEVFPTNVRNSLLSFCSMIGRFGSMVAPQTPLMAKYYVSAPAILFAICSILSGSLALFLPETKDTVLPTTLVDAEKIGKNEFDVKKEEEPEAGEQLLHFKTEINA